MDASGYLAVYDAQLRTEAETPSAERVELLGPLRLATYSGGRGFITYRDLAGAAHVSVADYFGDVPWADYPVAKSWYQRIKSRPSFRPLLADSVRGMAPAAAYADLDF